MDLDSYMLQKPSYAELLEKGKAAGRDPEREGMEARSERYVLWQAEAPGVLLVTGTALSGLASWALIVIDGCNWHNWAIGGICFAGMIAGGIGTSMGIDWGERRAESKREECAAAIRLVGLRPDQKVAPADIVFMRSEKFKRLTGFLRNEKAERNAERGIVADQRKIWMGLRTIPAGAIGTAKPEPEDMPESVQEQLRGL